VSRRPGCPLGLLEHRGDLLQAPVELRDRRRQRSARRWTVGLVEDRTDQRGEQPVLVLARTPETVAQEVHCAALPRRAEDLGDGRLQSGVGVGDRQLHTGQADA
jgi:hypothetical protein